MSDDVMSEAKLRVIEVDNYERYFEKATLSEHDFFTMAGLIAEVRRLKAEIRALQLEFTITDPTKEASSGSPPKSRSPSRSKSRGG